jgi:uncharacterized protein (TIGR02145 family)
MKKTTTNLFVAIVFIAIQANAQNISSFTDHRDGREYKTIEVCGRVWMAENLRAEIFVNGDSIPICKSDEETLLACENKIPAGFNFGYEETENKYVHGKLYNYYALTDSRGLCPEGWSVPLHNDYEYLLNFLWPSRIDNENLPINQGVLDFNLQLGGWMWHCNEFWGFGNINGWWVKEGGSLTADRYTRDDEHLNVSLDAKYSQGDAMYVRCIKK